MILRKQEIRNHGMVQDLSISKMPPNFAFENRNVKIQVNNDGLLLSITNINEPKLCKNATIYGEYLGHCVCRDKLVIFTTAKYKSYPKKDFIYRIDFPNNNSDDIDYTPKVLYEGDLNFKSGGHIECEFIYQSHDIQKVYWCDGYDNDDDTKNNFPRFINIITKGERGGGEFTPYTDANDFSFFPEVKKFPNVKVEKIITDITSSFPTGILQYYITYLYENGGETPFVANSSLITLDEYYRGGTAEEIAGHSIKITINNLDVNFDYVRVYSVYRTNINGDLVCSIVRNIKILKIDSDNNVIEFEDNNTNVERISSDEFYSTGGSPFYSKTIASKYNAMFFGNIKTPRYILNEDIKNFLDGYRKFSDGIYQCMLLNEQTRSVNNIVDNNEKQRQTALPENEKRTFKRGEIYRFAIQFQNAIGVWTEPYWIGDKKCSFRNTNNNLVTFCFMFGMGEDVITTFVNICNSAGYKNYRILIADAEISNGRKIATQGIICPTMFKLSERNEGVVHSFPSWVMRPFNGNLPSHHFEPLESAAHVNGEISSFYIRNKYPQVGLGELSKNLNAYTLFFYGHYKKGNYKKDTYLNFRSARAPYDFNSEYQESGYYSYISGSHSFLTHYDISGSGSEVTVADSTVAYNEMVRAMDGVEFNHSLIPDLNIFRNYLQGESNTFPISRKRFNEEVRFYHHKYFFSILYGAYNTEGFTFGGNEHIVDLVYISKLLTESYLGYEVSAPIDKFLNAVYDFLCHNMPSVIDKFFIQFISQGWLPVPDNLVGASEDKSYRVNDNGNVITGKIHPVPAISFGQLENTDRTIYLWLNVGRCGKDEYHGNLADGYFIDESIVTLHSQEIVNNPSSFNEKKFDFRIVGAALLNKTVSKFDITTKTSSYSSNNGLEKRTISNSKYNTFVGGYMYRDSSWEMPNNVIIPDATDLYKIFLWHDGGSIIGADESTTTSSGLKGEIPSLIKDKTFYNFNISLTTKYIKESYILKPHEIKTISGAGIIDGIYLYQSDYDGIELSEASPTFHSHGVNNYIYPYNHDDGYEKMPLHKTAVHIKFSSTPHAVIILDSITDRTRSLLPRLYPSEQYIEGQCGKLFPDSSWTNDISKATYNSVYGNTPRHYKWLDNNYNGKNYNWMGYDLYVDSDEEKKIIQRRLGKIRDSYTGAGSYTQSDAAGGKLANIINFSSANIKRDKLWTFVKNFAKEYLHLAFWGFGDGTERVNGSYDSIKNDIARLLNFNKSIEEGELYLSLHFGVSFGNSERGYTFFYASVYVRCFLNDGVQTKNEYLPTDVSYDETTLGEISESPQYYLLGLKQVLIGLDDCYDNEHYIPDDCIYRKILKKDVNIDQIHIQDVIKIDETDAKEIDPTAPYLLIGELYNDIPYKDLYGGYSDDAISKLTWLPSSPITEIKSYDEGFKTAITFGDTYFQRWDCLKTYPTTEEDTNKVVDITSVMLESHINLDERTDRNIEGYNIMSRPTNFNLFNDVYNQKDNIFSYNITKLIDKSTLFPNIILTSINNNPNDIIDSFTGANLNNVVILKSPITKLYLDKIYLYSFGEKEICLIKYLEDTLINTSEGALSVGKQGDSVDYKIISDVNGTTNYSVLKTEKGVYFVDTVNSFIGCLGNDGIKSLTINRLGNFFANNILDGGFTLENPNAFHFAYDSKNRDVYIINSNHCVIYNESLDSFTSFVDLQEMLSLFNVGATTFAIAELPLPEGIYPTTMIRLYKMDESENYNRGFAGFDPSKQKDIIKPLDYFLHYRVCFNPMTDKVFSNVDVLGDVGISALNKSKIDNLSPFNYIHVWNEYQDTNECEIKLSLLPSNLKQKFRVWRIDIPRDANSKYHLDRIRNHWIHLKLLFKQNDKKYSFDKIEIHGVDIQYME